MSLHVLIVQDHRKGDGPKVYGPIKQRESAVIVRTGWCLKHCMNIDLIEEREQMDVIADERYTVSVLPLAAIGELDV